MSNIATQFRNKTGDTVYAYKRTGVDTYNAAVTMAASGGTATLDMAAAGESWLFNSSAIAGAPGTITDAGTPAGAVWKHDHDPLNFFGPSFPAHEADPGIVIDIEFQDNNNGIWIRYEGTWAVPKPMGIFAQGPIADQIKHMLLVTNASYLIPEKDSVMDMGEYLRAKYGLAHDLLGVVVDHSPGSEDMGAFAAGSGGQFSLQANRNIKQLLEQIDAKLSLSSQGGYESNWKYKVPALQGANAASGLREAVLQDYVQYDNNSDQFGMTFDTSESPLRAGGPTSGDAYIVDTGGTGITASDIYILRHHNGGPPADQAIYHPGTVDGVISGVTGDSGSGSSTRITNWLAFEEDQRLRFVASENSASGHWTLAGSGALKICFEKHANQFELRDELYGEMNEARLLTGLTAINRAAGPDIDSLSSEVYSDNGGWVSPLLLGASVTNGFSNLAHAKTQVLAGQFKISASGSGMHSRANGIVVGFTDLDNAGNSDAIAVTAVNTVGSESLLIVYNSLNAAHDVAALKVKLAAANDLFRITDQTSAGEDVDRLLAGLATASGGVGGDRELTGGTAIDDMKDMFQYCLNVDRQLETFIISNDNEIGYANTATGQGASGAGLPNDSIDLPGIASMDIQGDRNALTQLEHLEDTLDTMKMQVMSRPVHVGGSFSLFGGRKNDIYGESAAFTMVNIMFNNTGLDRTIRAIYEDDNDDASVALVGNEVQITVSNISLASQVVSAINGASLGWGAMLQGQDGLMAVDEVETGGTPAIGYLPAVAIPVRREFANFTDITDSEISHYFMFHPQGRYLAGPRWNGSNYTSIATGDGPEVKMITINGILAAVADTSDSAGSLREASEKEVRLDDKVFFEYSKA